LSRTDVSPEVADKPNEPFNLSIRAAAASHNSETLEQNYHKT